MKMIWRETVKLSFWELSIVIGLLALLNTIIVMGFFVIVTWEKPVEQFGLRHVVLAHAPSTKTPLPTFTPVTPTPFATRNNSINPTSTGTFVPTLTPSMTPTPTSTRTPTNTPMPTETRPISAKSRVTGPTKTPTPDFDFIASVRRLSACENAGKHHIFVYVMDRDGKGIPDVQVRVWWDGGGEAILKTGDKIEHAGLTDFAMFNGAYQLTVMGASSHVVGPLSPDISRNEMCRETGNPVANSLHHYSYEVIFTKVK